MRVTLGSISPLAILMALGVSASSAQSDSATEPPLASQTAPAAEQPPGTISAHGLSQVRIVRLSQVRGEVRLDRTGEALEMAFVNLPIVAGERLQTLQGLAEVEFEDNSSLRLTPNSLVEFPVLGRDASGATSTTVRLLSGGLYVSLAGSKGSPGFAILAGKETIALAPSSHLRLELTAPATGKLVVFKGSAIVTAGNSTLVVDKKKAITFDPVSDTAPAFAHNDGAAAFDKWDKTEAEYHQQRAAMSFAGAGTSPYAYGLADLSYYGSFSNFGGCGSMWRPYLASAAWNPYGSGVWAYYPNAGYSWVSPYPWGWTPYHSGNWAYCPASGWGWQPGGSWNGLNNLAVTGTHGTAAPRRPVAPEPPERGRPSLVAVNTKAMPVSNSGSDGAFVFRRDSAGLGVPRGVFGNLNKLSQTASQHGMATTSVSESQAQRGMIPMSSSRASLGAAGGSEAGVAHGSAGSSSSMRSSVSSRSSSMSSASSAVGGHSGGGSGGGGGHH